MGTILIVEDNEIISDGLKRIIQGVDASQTIHSTGYAEQALQCAINQKVDIFLLDIELLDYSGVTLAEELRKLDRYKLTPIVFVTSKHSLELDAYRNTQCYQFITKPFDRPAVEETLRILIEHGIVKPKKEEKLLLKQKGFTISIFQKDILFIEARSRRLLAVTCHEVIELNTYTLGGLIAELTPAFIQCHRAFIVNTEWIYQVDKTNQIIHLRDDLGAVPIGERYRDCLAGVLR